MSPLRAWLRRERAADYARWLETHPWPPRPPGEPFWHTGNTLWFKAEPGTTWPPYEQLREPNADLVQPKHIFIGMFSFSNLLREP